MSNDQDAQALGERDAQALGAGGYPAGYRDPEWDGTLQQFRDVVLPARSAALEQSFTDALAELGFPDLRLAWEPIVHPAPLSLAKLGDLARQFQAPRIRTLRCHQAVLDALVAATDDRWPAGFVAGVASVDIVVSADLEPGAWEMLDKDGEVLERGQLGR